MNAWLPVVLLAVGLGAAPVRAEADSVGLGSGRDGPLAVTETGRVINRYSQVMGPAAPGDDVLLVAESSHFPAGGLVMVFQATGLVPEPTPGLARPLSLPEGTVGQWEFARVARVGEGTLTLSAPLTHAYAAQVSQVIRVPEYTRVHVQKGASLRAEPWDGRTGGVLVFLASETLHNDGELSATGAGFRGGSHVPDALSAESCSQLAVALRPGAQKGEGVAMTQYGPARTGRESVSNGGGGGLCPLAGGGGGGNGGAGGGGQSAVGQDKDDVEWGGQGGTRLVYSSPTYLGFGGGGGGGHSADWSVSRGGAGGGVVVARARALTGTGMITADGEAGEIAGSGGAGGGGAGGSVSLWFTGQAACGAASARGGDGGTYGTHFMTQRGAGGGGGDGRVTVLAEGHDSCPRLVSSGLAHEAKASGTVHGKQDLEAGKCFGQDFKIETPVTGARINTSTGLSVRGSAKTGLKDIEIQFGYLDPKFFNPPRKAEAVNNKWAHAFNGSPDDAGREIGFVDDAKYLLIAKASGGDCTSTTVDFTVDLKPPALVLDTSYALTPKNPSNRVEAAFKFSSPAESNSLDFKEFQCALGKTGAFNKCSTGISYPIAQEREYTFKVKAIDKAGNEEEKAYTWVADFTAPTTRLDKVPAKRTSSTSFAFEFSSKDLDVARFQCAVDSAVNSAFRNCTTGDSISFAEGEHNFYVRAIDHAENTGSVLSSYSWVVDTTPPTVSLDLSSVPRARTNETLTGIKFSTNDAHFKEFQCSLRGTIEQDFAPCSSGQEYRFSEGPQTFLVQGVDLAGNKSAPLRHQWYVDLAPPDFNVDKVPPAKSTSRDALFTFSSSATDFKEFQCAEGNMAESSFSSCASPKTLKVKADGTHTFYVRAVDEAGNKRTPFAYEWRVDTTPPTVQVSEPAQAELLNTRLPFFRGTTEPDSLVQLLVTVGTSEVELGKTSSDAYGHWYFITPQDKAPAFADGEHSISVRATDSFGNQGVENAYRSFSVDTIPPKTSISERPPQVHRSYKSDFVFSASEPDVTFQCQLDGGAYLDCTEKTSLKLGNGAHTLVVRAKDKAGNTDPNPATYVWSVHLDQPLYPDITEPANGSKVNTGTPTISGRAIANVEIAIIIDGQPIEKTALSDADGYWSFQPTVRLEPGRHSLSGEIKDISGAESESRSPEIFFTVVILDEVNEAIGGGVGFPGCSSSGSFGSFASIYGLFSLILLRRKRNS